MSSDAGGGNIKQGGAGESHWLGDSIEHVFNAKEKPQVFNLGSFNDESRDINSIKRNMCLE